ncbi:MAG: efflux RND transporter periplasmic adaptor subunit [Aureliella sp.]
MMFPRSLLLVSCLVAIAGWHCMLAGCKRAPVTSDPPPAIEVEGAYAINQNIVGHRVFTGRTAAVNSVDIRARVSGYLRKAPRSSQVRGEVDSEVDSEISTEPAKPLEPEVVVSEGSQVNIGDLLFVIDPEPYVLALEQSEGTRLATEARWDQAVKDFGRAKKIENTISPAEYDSSEASADELKAQVVALKANSARARLDLDNTQVHAPIAGLLGQTLVTPGNLVVADTTILTTVVSNNPIYVDFEVDEQSLLDYRSRMLAGKVKNARETSIAIRLGLANEDGFPHVGTIDFVNNRTDPNTGNTRIRATFDNSSGVLSPGLFARVQVPFTAEYSAILIPTIAIGMDQKGRYVMLDGSGHKVERREVELGDIIGHLTAIREGIEVGERVVTSGLQKIRDGSLVHFKPDETSGESE